MIWVAVAAAIVAGLYLATAVAVLAPRKPGYRHLNHTISELGETGSPVQRLVSIGVFLPVGFLLLVTAFAVRSTIPAAAALALAIAIGYVGATVLLSAFLIGYLPPSLLRGAVQRMSEMLFFGSLALAIIRGATVA